MVETQETGLGRFSVNLSNYRFVDNSQDFILRNAVTRATRHSHIDLTMDVYTDPVAFDIAGGNRS